MRTLFLRAWPGAYSVAALATVATMVDAWMHPAEGRGELSASITFSLLVLLIPITLVTLVSGAIGSFPLEGPTSKGKMWRVFLTTLGGGVVFLLPPFIFAEWMLPVGAFAGMVGGLITSLGITPRQSAYWGIVCGVGLSSVLLVIVLRWLT